MTAHILVIDDDPVQRRLLKNMIERSGHVAHMAENGRAGLDMLDRKGGLINVILLDLMMPGMDGFEMIRRLRNNRDLDRMDIIIVSAISGNKDQLAQLPSDITIFGKPIPFHEIKGFILGRIAARQRVA